VTLPFGCCATRTACLHLGGRISDLGAAHGRARGGNAAAPPFSAAHAGATCFLRASRAASKNIIVTYSGMPPACHAYRTCEIHMPRFAVFSRYSSLLRWRYSVTIYVSPCLPYAPCRWRSALAAHLPAEGVGWILTSLAGMDFVSVLFSLTGLCWQVILGPHKAKRMFPG